MKKENRPPNHLQCPYPKNTLVQTPDSITRRKNFKPKFIVKDREDPRKNNLNNLSMKDYNNSASMNVHSHVIGGINPNSSEEWKYHQYSHCVDNRNDEK